MEKYTIYSNKNLVTTTKTFTLIKSSRWFQFNQKINKLSNMRNLSERIAKLIWTQNNPKLAQLILGQLSFLVTFVVPAKGQNGAKTFPSHSPVEQHVGL